MLAGADAPMPSESESPSAMYTGAPAVSVATGAVEGATYDYAPAAPEIMKRVGEIEAVCVRHGVGADAMTRRR